MNKTQGPVRRTAANFVFFLAALLSANALAVSNDTYSIDEDSVLNVGAPGVLINDSEYINSFLPLGPAKPSVGAVNVSPNTTPGFPGTITFSGNLGGAGRPLEMKADGSFFYDPRGRFDFLAAGEAFVDTSTNAAGATTHYYLGADSSNIALVTITVNGVNDAPSDIGLTANTLSENAGNNFSIGTLSTVDADTSDTHQYTLVSGAGSTDNALFSITGSGLIAQNDLDAELKTSYSIRVRTTDFRADNGTAAGGSFDEVFTITVTDLNDVKPVITAAQAFNIAEDTAISATVGVVAATDGDISATTFSFTEAGGANTNLFAINNAGSITVEDNSAFDFESPPTSYTYRVRVSDGLNTSSVETVTVNLTDANDVVPTFTNANTISVDENVAAVLTVTTSDPDTVGSVSYSLSGGADVLKFSVAGTGELTFSPPVDFEALEDADNNNVFLVQVRANDGANVVDQLITVNLQNLSDTNPTGNDNSATINEDATYNFQLSDFGFADADGDTFTSVGLTTLPSKGDIKLSGANVTVAGTQILTTDIPNLTYVPDPDESGTAYAAVQFSVRDSSAADDATANSFSFDVTAVADAPGITVTNTASGNEDTAISLSIAGALVDTDGSEALSFTVSNVPTGATLNNGVDGGTGTWSLTQAQLTGLTITPKLHDDSEFTLTVASIATEGANNDTAQSTATIAITVTAVVDTPNFAVTAAAAGNEDVPINLVISSSLVDTDGSEILTFKVTGVPTGATLNNGTNAGGGVWNLVQADIAGLTILNKQHDDSDFSINVTATSTDNDASTTTVGPASIAITVTAVADAPIISVTSSVTKDEDDNPWPLTISGDLVDTDGSESMTYQISGVLASATLSAGVDQGGGVWTLTEAEAETGLSLTMDTHVADDFQIDVRALATETNDGSTQFSAAGSGRINIFVTDKADAPSISVNPLATGNEDTAIPLTITGNLTDLDGSETLTMVITGHPASSTFSAGSDLGGGSWAVDVSDLSGLTISAAANNNDDFTLTVTSTAKETANGDTKAIAGTISVQIQPVNDAPTLSPTTFAVDENSPNGTIVGTVVAVDVEPVGAETAQGFTYAIDGTAFNIDNGGVIRVADVDQLDFETTPQFNVTVTANDTGLPSLSDNATITINLNGLDDNVPEAVDDATSVNEQETVNFNVVDNDTDLDVPAQTLFVSEVNGDMGLVGVPFDVEVDGLTLGSLTINGDGTASFVTTSVVTVEKFLGTATYRVTDGDTASTNEGTISISINPRNDNEPELTATGTALEASGVSFEEDQYPSLGTPLTVIVNDLFKDLDIDVDGVLDSNTLEDNDSLIFSVVSNSNSAVVQYNLADGDLSLFSGQNDYGVSTLVLRATDTADPTGNITSVELSLVVTVLSVNDAPTYQIGSYSNYDIDEDSGDILINLDTAFIDADKEDDTAGDEVVTYQLTITDSPNDFVQTTMIDDDGLTVVSDDTPDGEARTLVVTTTSSTITLDVFDDAHGLVEITVRATDQGRPPELPADAIPLFDEATFRVTVNGIGDDQPAAADDHYNDFPALIINEDDPVIFFDVIENDYQGDVPAIVISAGQLIVDSSGADQAYVSTTRLADPNDTGDFSIEINGEVSCAHFDCLDGQRGGTTVSGDGISDTAIAYKPRINFNGEDTFTYCIEDSQPANEAPFNPPNDPRCATVTLNVLPVNDIPVVDEVIVITMEQADDLIVSEEDGLKNFVRDLDNTHIDGKGCDPLLLTCNPLPTDPQPDRLYFYFAGALTQQGQLFAPFTDDGAFNYRPNATFSGDDSFAFEVCDAPTPGDSDQCAPGTVSIQIAPLEGAPEGSSDGTVQFDYQLAETPLELPIGPEPNVLIVNDDSGSMAWDIMSDGSSGLYQVSTGHSLYYVNKATAGSGTYIAPAETDAPNEGLWRLRNSNFNTVYYNREIRYKPWEGLDTDDNEFPDSTPTSARHNPLASSPTTNLTQTIDFTGRAVVTTPRTCTTRCTRYRRGRCRSYRNTCTGGSGFQRVSVTNFYIPRYYEWTDLDGDAALDSTPSPANENSDCLTNRVLGCSEGELVEIRDDGTLYPRGSDRTDCQATGTSCTYDEEIQNFANWFTYYRSREFTAKAALGIVIANAENLRVGYAKLNSESNIIPVISMNTSERTGAKADLLDAVYATNSRGGTPLRRSLRDAGRYFECKANDIFDSSGETSAGNPDCPILPAPDGNCQQNFTLLITDGTWNGYSPWTGNSDGDNNTDFDGGAFAGSNFTTLADVAMLYYERDLHPDVNDEVPTTARDTALAADDAFVDGSNEIMHQHMTTYTVGFGVRGLVDAEPVNYATGFNWGNPFSSDLRKTDDVRHAAYNGRGEYLDASNASDLADELVEAFEEFSQGSGAASAVSFNSQEIQEDTLIFRAFYNTKINTGDLIAQSLTDDGLLEEPVWSSAEALDLVDPDNREIITYDDINSTGIAFRPGTLNTDQRNVFISNLGASEAQKNAEVTQRVNYLRGDSANERPVGNFRERPAIGGRLGDIVHSTPVFVGAPNRIGRDQSPFPQSDLYSSFRATNADRDQVIYVASNDGMVHGMDASDGSEVFGYVPNNLMLGAFSRRITNLLDFEYEHKFFVDLTPAVNDVYMDSDGDGDKEWITFLIGGHGAGAKAYFALNVTDPTKLTETTASDVVLWEFTEEDDTYPTDSDGNPLLNGSSMQRQDLQDTPQPVKDLGYSFSVPTIAMSNLKDSNQEQIWVSMFGNGYNSTAGIAKLFLLFIDEGVDGTWCHPDMIHNETLNGPLPAECIGRQDFVKIDTGFGVQDGFPNGLGTPRGIDVDGNGTLDYAYAGDTFGNMFRFDLTSDDYDDWSFTKIFEASYEDSNGDVTLQPITTQPIVTAHPTENDGFIVIFASGSYITVPDGRNKEIQSIYGLWDRLSPELLDFDDLVQQRFINLFDSDFGNVRALTNNEVDYSTVGSKKGWYNHLDAVAVNGNQLIDDPEFPGERAIRNIQLRGGLAFVNSVIPRSDTSCVDIAGGFALSFCPGTGGTNCLGSRGIFDLDNDGAFDDGDEVDGQVVAGTRFEDAVPTDSSFIEDKRITQLSDKSLDSTKTNTSGGNNTGRLSWKELDSIN